MDKCIEKAKFEEFLTECNTIKSRRGRILCMLAKVLNTISENRGYCLDVCDVSFDVHSWNSVLESETPKIFIVDDTADVERKAGRTRFYTWKVLVFGVVKEKEMEEFEEHLADVQECIEINGHLGGVVNKTEVNSIRTDNQLFSEKENTHLYEMEVQLEYVQCFADPR